MRYDPIYNIWVSISEQRNDRPKDFSLFHEKNPEKENFAACCPFCEGNEAETPQERDVMLRETEETLDNYRRPNAPGWMVRAVPNRYPFVEPDSEWTLQRIGPYFYAPNVGIQEVLVDVPYHASCLSGLSAEEFQYLIHFYHRRMHQIRKEYRWHYAQLFKNQGAQAGASLTHIHTQLVALPYIPQSLVLEQKFLQSYAHDNGQCYHCMVMEYEMRERWRFVDQTEYFNVFCPFASRFSGEIHILPRRHVPCFVQSTREELDDLAELLRKTLRRLENVLTLPTYNLVLRNSPWEYDKEGVVLDSHFHWRMEILPRMTKLAGYELGTGYYVNPISPERAAVALTTESFRI
ncbi:MAG: DUF4931 domain-containing protein [Planctomycetia bacterium]|nr:DUF4931 domain-containing protein [Planctomycetia bacterium]